MLVKDILNEIDREISVVSPESTVYAAIKLMDEHDFGAVAVMDNESLIGIFTERDYARKLLLQGLNSMRTQIRKTMSSGVISVSPDLPVEKCCAMMVENSIRHLPVVKDGELLGLISIADLAKATIAITV
jgi:CBS domain-containing protein